MNPVQQFQSVVEAQSSGAASAMSDHPEPAGDYLEVRFCPCCGTSAARAQGRVASSPPAETLSPTQHGNFLSGYTHARVFFTYFECPNCSAMFCRSYYRQSQLDGLYGRQAENMASIPLPARQRTQEDYARVLRRNSRMAGNFLEIGPDIGLFASSLAKMGSFDHFWLYEPNRDVHQALAENFLGRNHTISPGLFRSADVPAESVSTAVMIHRARPSAAVSGISPGDPGQPGAERDHFYRYARLRIVVGARAGEALAALHAAASTAFFQKAHNHAPAGKRI